MRDTYDAMLDTILYKSRLRLRGTYVLSFHVDTTGTQTLDSLSGVNAAGLLPVVARIFNERYDYFGSRRYQWSPANQQGQHLITSYRLTFRAEPKEKHARPRQIRRATTLLRYICPCEFRSSC